MDKKATGIVAYITIFGWLVAYFAGDRENARFHLNQGLVVDLAFLAIGIMAGIPFGIVRALAALLDIVVVVFCIMGIIYAAQDQEKEIPLLVSFKILK